MSIARFFLVLLWVSQLATAVAQNSSLDSLVDQGISLHDQGDYQGAIQKYDQVLAQSPRHFEAQTEKAMSLFYLGNFDACIQLCERVIKLNPRQKELYLIYTTLGNALDLEGRPQEAIDAYEKGIGRFPDHYMLHYNLGVTCLREGASEKGVLSLRKGLEANPYHPGGHFAMGLAMFAQGRKTLSLMALTRFLLLEVGTDRSQRAFFILEGLLGRDRKKGREVQPLVLNGLFSEDDFSVTDMMIGILANDDLSKKARKAKKGMTEVEIWGKRYRDLIRVLAEEEEAGKLKGPLTQLYLPFFLGVKEAGHLEAMIYILFAAQDEHYVDTWLESHVGEVEELVQWTFRKVEKE